jgi:hypothetical protein
MSGVPPVPQVAPSVSEAARMARVNNLFMAALLWASRNDCSCKACQRLKKVAELMEESLEAGT